MIFIMFADDCLFRKIYGIRNGDTMKLNYVDEIHYLSLLCNHVFLLVL